jgi:hypothetical protein
MTKSIKLPYKINLRISESEYQFLQDLRNRDILISSYIRTAIKSTPRFLNYILKLKSKEL